MQTALAYQPINPIRSRALHVEMLAKSECGNLGKFEIAGKCAMQVAFL
jgi:hypothetical protein